MASYDDEIEEPSYLHGITGITCCLYCRILMLATPSGACAFCQEKVDRAIEEFILNKFGRR